MIMTYYSRCAAGLALAMAMQVPAAALATSAPATGSWARVTIYLASVSGALCPASLKAGESTVGQVYYAGGGNAGGLLYFYAPGATVATADIYRATLPDIPASSGGSSTGSTTVTDLELNEGLSGTATLTVTWGTPSAYFLTLDAQVLGCSLDLNMTAEQTGT